MLFPRVISAGLLLAVVGFGQIVIKEIHVEGNKRLPEPAIVAATELKISRTVGKSDLDSAGQRLFNTGLFTGVNYRYEPRNGGSSVVFTVQEDKAPVHVVVDIPGLDEQQFWRDQTGTLIAPLIPSSPEAAAYYQAAIERYLAKSGRRESIRSSDEADLDTHQSMLVFRPENRPTIANVAFEGNSVIPAKALHDAVARAAIGVPWSERDFRKILEVNLRPIYEEKALLTVTFGKVETAGGNSVVVTTSVSEGRAWNLGKMSLTGEGVDAALLKAGNFHEGSAANWKQVSEGISAILKEVHRNGFIAARANSARTLHDDSGTVDVAIDIAKGKLYRFGELFLTGLTGADLTRAMNLWKLHAGEPMNSPYVDEFLKAVFETVRPKQGRVSSNLKVHDDVADVVISFQ